MPPGGDCETDKESQRGCGGGGGSEEGDEGDEGDGSGDDPEFAATGGQFGRSV